MACAVVWIKLSVFKPWPDTLCYVLGQDTFTHTVPFFTQANKWVLATLMLGLTLRRIIKHPIQWGVEMLLVISCYRNWDKLLSCSYIGHLSHMQTSFF